MSEVYNIEVDAERYIKRRLYDRRLHRRDTKMLRLGYTAISHEHADEIIRQADTDYVDLDGVQLDFPVVKLRPKLGLTIKGIVETSTKDEVEGLRVGKLHVRQQRASERAFLQPSDDTQAAPVYMSYQLRPPKSLDELTKHIDAYQAYRDHIIRDLPLSLDEYQDRRLAVKEQCQDARKWYSLLLTGVVERD